jgi:exodeoxyribonuclease VII small subunit
LSEAVDPITFEEALARLEEAVKRLEDPDLALDEAVRLYEEGTRLATLCDTMLEAAQLRVARLSATGAEVPLPPEEPAS